MSGPGRRSVPRLVVFCVLLAPWLACQERLDPAPEAAASGAVFVETSSTGRYVISLRPEEGNAPLGQIHSWIVHVDTSSGDPVLHPTRLALKGGMPQHDHGFLTKPSITQALGDGDYRVDGIKFHMPGEWTLEVTVVAEAGADYATFRVPVAP